MTIRLGQATIDYFERLSDQTEIPYQTLMNLYLRDCALQHKRLHLEWAPPKSGDAA